PASGSSRSVYPSHHRRGWILKSFRLARANQHPQRAFGYSRYFENVKSCAFWGTWQLKHCFTMSVAIGLVESPPAHAWNPQPPVDAYFFESLTMRVMALRAAPSR